MLKLYKAFVSLMVWLVSRYVALWETWLLGACNDQCLTKLIFWRLCWDWNPGHFKMAKAT